MTTRTFMATAAVSLAACHHRGGSPSLSALSPASADVSRGQVVEVVVQGSGFDSLNVVHFGVIELRQVPRRSATELRFTVPLDDVQQPARGEAPPHPLASGTYAVRISTARGTSNALMFTLTAGGNRND
jgi:hypothetical protein